MKKIVSTGLVSLLLGAALPAMAQTGTGTQPQTQDPAQTQMQTQTQPGSPSVTVSEAKKTKATVESVDAAEKRVTLKTSDGRTVHLKLPNARNLDQLSKGDIVTVDYLQSTAVAMAKPGQEPTGPETQQYVAVPEKGQMPGGVAVQTIKETATIEKINAKKREVTLKGPEGNTVQLSVDPRVTNLNEFKKGDQIVITYTEAVAISVQKPQSKG